MQALMLPTFSTTTFILAEGYIIAKHNIFDLLFLYACDNVIISIMLIYLEQATYPVLLMFLLQQSSLGLVYIHYIYV